MVLRLSFLMLLAFAFARPISTVVRGSGRGEFGGRPNGRFGILQEEVMRQHEEQHLVAQAQLMSRHIAILLSVQRRESFHVYAVVDLRPGLHRGDTRRLE